MESGDLSPLTVAAYSKDFLVQLVRIKTGSDQRSQVSGKTQLNYLCHYLEEPHIGAKTIVVEDQYIDRHYLEDYSEYYARCFSSYPKNCSRAHFFSLEFSDIEFRDALKRGCPGFREKLSGSYLGYAVIRPIPHTFFARICIKPYGALVSEPGYKVITKKHGASLFGIPLSVETTLFLEQDKVVSACATSAIWTLLSASDEVGAKDLPSPSAITKSAFHLHYDGGRTFPTAGLTTEQVARSLKHFGLEPTVLKISNSHSLNAVKEAVFAYTSNDIPVLIGGSIFNLEGTDGQPELLGKHLACALGYHVEETPLVGSGAINNRAHAINKIYVHDDRYGPFVRLDANSTPHGKVLIDGKEAVGFTLSLKGNVREVFVPDVLVIGHYHKIRIPYAQICGIVDGLHSSLKTHQELLVEDLKNSPATGAETADDRDDAAYDQEVSKALEGLLGGVWELALVTSNSLKTEALASQSIVTFNGASDKATFLMQSMPKYMWRCRIADGSTCLTDLLFDATEIPQGGLFLGYIAYDPLYERMWKWVSKSIARRDWESLPGDLKETISCVTSFFARFGQSAFLNTLYGPLRLPVRKLKDGEKDQHENIKGQQVTVVRRGPVNWLDISLNKSKKYIWVIDELGDLVIGEDIAEKGASQGHPTLIDGRPARLGGELHFQEVEEKWAVNLWSGTYSSHIDPTSNEGRMFLDNVIEHNFHGLNAFPEIGSSRASKGNLD